MNKQKQKPQTLQEACNNLSDAVHNLLAAAGWYNFVNSIGRGFDKLYDKLQKNKKYEEQIMDMGMILYHVTTEKKAKLYHETGFVLKPVRGFTTLQAAMAWAIKTGRTVIYEVNGKPAYKLPDHHNAYGEAWWIDENVSIENIKCVFSANKDA